MSDQSKPSGGAHAVLDAAEGLPDWAGAGDASSAELAEILAELAQLLPSQDAEPGLRQRLLADLGGSQRYAPFTSRLQRLFDLDEPAIQAFFQRLERAAEWQPFPIPGVQLLDIEGGPATAGADVGLVRLAPNTTFPHHRHAGLERVLVLEGSYVDDDGREYVSGDWSEKAEDTEHEFRVGADGCTFAVVVYGVEIDGVRVGATKPD